MLRANHLILSWCTWLSAVAISVVSLCKYEFTPGQVGTVPVYWTSDLGVPQPISPYPTLLVSLHPKCSCSLATLALLSELFASPGARANVIVLLSDSAGKSAEWKDDLDSLTTRIRSELHGTVLIDVDSKNAKRFGMLTSGHILGYGSDGSLLYSGGITSSRGERSNGPSFDALRKIVAQEKLAPVEPENKPVFGCGLTHA